MSWHMAIEVLPDRHAGVNECNSSIHYCLLPRPPPPPWCPSHYSEESGCGASSLITHYTFSIWLLGQSQTDQCRLMRMRMVWCHTASWAADYKMGYVEPSIILYSSNFHVHMQCSSDERALIILVFRNYEWYKTSAGPHYTLHLGRIPWHQGSLLSL